MLDDKEREKVREEFYEWYTERADTYQSSTGWQKMWNYFLDVTKKEYFVKTVRDLKKKYNVPEAGFLPNEEGYYLDPSDKIKSIPGQDIHSDVMELICKKYKLHAADYSEVILHYIYFNKLHPLMELGSCGMFRVSDVISEKEDPFGEYLDDSDDEAYPIAIRISPYASQRDIVNFVKNKSIWKEEIEFLQKKYRDESVSIGKIRKRDKDLEKRNDIIYKNRDKTLKEIRKILAGEKIFLDDGLISKIISLEKKRRT